MDDFKMDRSFVSSATFAEADDHVTFYKDKTLLERLNYACAMINQIFNTNPNLKVDRTIISSRKHAKSI